MDNFEHAVSNRLHDGRVESSRFETERASLSAARRAGELIRDGSASRRRLRGRTWRRVRHGQYVPETCPADGADPLHRDSIAAAATQRIMDSEPQIIPGLAVAGWAAAFVQGVDWLDGLDPWTGAQLPVDLVGTSVRRRNRADVRYRFTPLADDGVTCHGLPVTNALRTAVDGARWSASAEEALVFVDAMVRFGLLCSEKFRTHVEGLQSIHGLAKAREASLLTRENVWSPWESRLRYCYSVQAKLPEPLLDVAVFDDDGLLLGHPDLFDPESALAVEFDGKQHREREQHRRDNLREERFEDAGVTVVRTDSLDLRRGRRSQLIERMTAGRRRGLRRDRSQDRWVIDPRIWT